MRVIRLSLNDVDRAVREIEDYHDSLDSRVKELIERLGAIGVRGAKLRFAHARYDGDNDVVVDEPIWLDENTLAVKASGSAILFIEFGAGIHNATHPLAEKLNIMPHGTYGKRQGMKTSWTYYGSAANAKAGGREVRNGVIRTRGNDASRSMYDTAKEMRDRVREIAIEVFKS